MIFYGAGIPVWFGFGLYRTAPKFEWVSWWGCLYYPKVRTAADPTSPKGASLGHAKGKLGTIVSNDTDLDKKPPPPPSNPPEIPAPEKGSVQVPHLHAATVHALEQARIGQGANMEDLSARKLKMEQDDAAMRAKKEASWGISENLALTSAESSTLTQKQKIARFMFTLVIDPFRDDLFFWMFVILFRSFLLAMVSIFFADEPVYQATLALLVLFLYTLATAYFQPYVNPAMNKLEFMTMSCSCLVLFSGFLFVGEPSKTDVIFNVLAGICLAIIIISFLYIGKVVFSKLEEVFHCWNCRRVPTVQAPTFANMNEIARTMRTEIMAGHQSGAAGVRKALNQQQANKAAVPRSTGTSAAGTTMPSEHNSRESSRSARDVASHDLASPSHVVSPNGKAPLLNGGLGSEEEKISDGSTGSHSSSQRAGGAAAPLTGNARNGSRDNSKTSQDSTGSGSNPSSQESKEQVEGATGTGTGAGAMQKDGPLKSPSGKK